VPRTAVLWLRRDLRLADNPALVRALEVCERVVPLYVHAPDEEHPWQPGAASRWWLHHSLSALDASLRERGSGLIVRCGNSLEQLRQVAASCAATEVFWNRLYEPATVVRDTRVKQALREAGLRCESLSASLLFEPWELTRGRGEPYRVFGAFWRKGADSLARLKPPLPAPAALPPLPPQLDGISVADLGLLPRIGWDSGLRETWRPGEAQAQKSAQQFFAGPVVSYAEHRDLPAVRGTSRLSPHLHFGEIGPRQLVWLAREETGSLDGPSEHFVRELGWREFAYHLLFHFPTTGEEPLDRRFDSFPWRSQGMQPLLDAWKAGRTGIPLVDAGMRELWQSGWMHNRVRMVVASLLTKNLRLPWQEGTRWFWDTLVDADLAANTLGWQWTAGCGADAAPYFRIFNPVRQGERFDPQGAYVKRWCPELERLPQKYIHQPWSAPPAVLAASGIELGKDYPRPIVDLAASRQEALTAWGRVK